LIILLLFLAGLLAGALNSVAGGGSFITLPALLYAGVSPVAANATSSFAVWPASVTSATVYRRELGPPRTWLSLGAVSLVGGLAGAILLVKTSDTSFMLLLPWLMLLAAITFSLSGRITKPASGTRSHDVRWWVLLVQLVIATYGGYFGGGAGIMMLATLASSGMTDIHEMNGLKAVLGAAINAVALAAFVVQGVIEWAPGVVMAVGGIAGGYAGASLARRVNREAIRSFIVVVAWTMTVYFFLR
jgi:uncharacterized membrane protein YfcA